MSRNHELDEFGMRPSQRHRRAGRLSGKKPPLRQGRAVPHLLRHHAARPGHRRHGFEIRRRIVSSDQFVVTAFAGEKRPRTAPAGAVERPPVSVLAIAVAVVAVPSGPVRRIHFEQCIGNRRRCRGSTDRSRLRNPKRTSRRKSMPISSSAGIARFAFGSSSTGCFQRSGIAEHLGRRQANIIAVDRQPPGKRRVSDCRPELDATFQKSASAKAKSFAAAAEIRLRPPRPRYRPKA